MAILTKVRLVEDVINEIIIKRMKMRTTYYSMTIKDR